MSGVEFAGQKYVKAAMDRHLASVRENRMDGCASSQNGTVQSLQTKWRCRETGEPARDRPRQLTPELLLYLPPTTPFPAELNEGAYAAQINGTPPRYRFIHTPLCSAQCFNCDTYPKDHKRDKECILALLTDDETFTGVNTMDGVVIQLTAVLPPTAA